LRHRTSIDFGNDELAAIGKRLQAAAYELIDAEDQRQELVNAIALDIRTPIVEASSTLERLAQDLDPAHPAAAVIVKNLRSTRGNFEKVLVLVNDLLTLDQLDAGHIELNLRSENIKAVVNEAMHSIGSLAGAKDIALVADCDDCILPLDRNRIIQVLTNLINNAVKFSPRNSTIKVQALEDGARVIVAVVDQGPGMTPDVAARVFDKFYRDENQKGAAFGLGLAIARLIVRSHGGEIGLDTAAGQGSTFYFTLPKKRSV
ncbi:MAG: hypothetical protein KGS72_19145, partial [Cyanobacteria bacterium REEB67]|nr:hypothetical protein [Cyanobacteria bacterium REEB67]